MTEEEDKAIKDCDSIFICLDDAMSEESANDYRKSYKILKNLIEKQSIEIEELKEDNKKKSIVIIEYQDLYEKLQDKIKAIIEELQEDIKYSANPLSIDNSKFAIIVLRSLLRKEFPVTITKEELEKRWKG